MNRFNEIETDVDLKYILNFNYILYKHTNNLNQIILLLIQKKIIYLLSEDTNLYLVDASVNLSSNSNFNTKIIILLKYGFYWI